MFASRQNFALYAAVLATLIGLGLWLRTDLLSGRDEIVRTQSIITLQKSRFLGQGISTDIVWMRFVLESIREQVRPSDLIYPNPDIARQHQISELLNAKGEALPKPSTRNLALFNSDCVYTASAGLDVVGARSNNTLCKGEAFAPGVLHIQYIPVSKSLSRDPVLLLTLPFTHPDGRFAGGAVVVVSLTGAHEAVTTRFAARPGEIIALLDDKETILAHSANDENMIGKPFDDFYQHDPAENPNVPHSHVVRAGQQDLITGMSTVPGTTLTMMVGSDRDRALEEWQRRARQLVAGYAGIAVLSLLVTVGYGRMRQQRDEMTRLATTDVLTGVANRRQFMHVLKHECQRARQEGRLLSVLMIDIDRFKRINDTFGHPMGDQVIVTLAEVLAHNIRPHDTVARIGGEEFAVLLPGLSEDHAETVAERLRAEVAAQEVFVAERSESLYFSISVGVAMMRSSDDGAGDMLLRADKALYAAKESGRNRVMISAAPPMQPSHDEAFFPVATHQPAPL